MTSLVHGTATDVTTSGRRQPLYLAAAADPVFAVVHTPDGVTRSHTGVVLCPAFGWDELCTHRSVRTWADEFAAAGDPALRFDLPGTGDSGGSPRDPDRLDAWREAVTTAAEWLRTARECHRIVAVGIGLGGMVAVCAVAAGAPIDDLVLWSVPARGSLLLREMRAFAKIAAQQTLDGEPELPHRGLGPPAPPPPPAPADDGSLEVAGFVLSRETVEALEALDLTALEVPDAARRRVLLLGRDTLAPDRRLREHFEGSGAQTTVMDGTGYGKMMTHPQFAETPHEVLRQVEEWVAAAPPAEEPWTPSTRPVESSDHAEIRVGDTRVRETAFEFDHRGRRLSGVLAQPLTAGPANPGLCAVFLNAGAVRRIGPNRMWVECARRWAARGVTSLRLDAGGLGDSDGDERVYYRTSEFYRHEIAEDVRAAFDELEARGVGSSFLVGGLCSGAYWGFHAGLLDERVHGLVLVNLWSFFWSEELAAARDARRARVLLRAGAWRDVARIATSQGRIGRLARAMLRRAIPNSWRNGGGGALAGLGTAIDDALGALRDRHVQTLLLLGYGEPLAEDFIAEHRVERLGEWPNLHLERIPLEDHIFRPVWAQAHVHHVLDDALERTLHEPQARSSAHGAA